MKTEPVLEHLGKLVGNWTTEATHPATPGLVVHGTVEVTWLEGEKFLIVRSRTDHEDFPNSIAIIGVAGRDRVEPGAAAPNEGKLSMSYFDSRGVSRVFDATVDATTWWLTRNAPGFSQRFTGTLSADGNTIDGQWQLCEDDTHWNDDLKITYRRHNG